MGRQRHPEGHHAVSDDERFVPVPVSLLRECRRLMIFAEYTQESFARRRDATNAANEIVRYIESGPHATAEHTDKVRRATPSENLRILSARLSEHLSPAEKRDLEQAAASLTGLPVACGENASVPAAEAGGCGVAIHEAKDVYRCVDCGIAFHRTCVPCHFGGAHSAGGRLEEMPTDEVIKAICTWMAWDYDDRAMRGDASGLYRAILSASGTRSARESIKIEALKIVVALLSAKCDVDPVKLLRETEEELRKGLWAPSPDSGTKVQP